MKKTFKGLLMLALAFSILAAGCSGGTEIEGGETGGDGAQEKNELVYAQSVSITDLDTAGMQPQGYPAGYEAAFAIYNGLVKFDEEMNFVGDLATEWNVEEDGITWTFKLKEGVTFHDGTPFNADAVVFAYERMTDPEINIGAYTLWEPIDKVVKVDDYTVQIVTKEPYGGLLNVMAHGSALIPSSAAVEEHGDKYGLQPVGTGPYKLESFDPGTQLVLSKNENYFDGEPKYETLTFKYVSDASARIAALKSGEVDVIDAVPVENANELESDPNIDVIDKSGLQVFGVGLNQNNEILQDKDVRQALNYAIDKTSLIDIVFKGYGTVIDSPLAPDTIGYVSSGDYTYNVEKAEQLLESAGWTKGQDGVFEKDGQRLAFNFLVPEGSYPKDVMVAENIQSQLKAAGVAVEINTVEQATFWDNLKVPAGTDYDMVLWGYNPSHGDGYIHLDALFAANPDEGAAPPQWNHIWYNNSEVDQLLDEASAQVDLDQRTELLGQAQKQIWEEAPYIWLYSNTIITAKSSDVEGVQVLPVVFTLVHE